MDSEHQLHHGMKKLKIIGIIIICLLLANFAYQMWDRYYRLKTPQHVAREVCDLRDKACRVFMPQGKVVQLGLKPRTIPADKPLVFDVRATNIPVKNAHISLFALDNPRIAPQHIGLEAQAKGRYRSSATLNSEQQDNDNWLAIIVLETDGEDIVVPYKFHSDPLQPQQ